MVAQATDDFADAHGDIERAIPPALLGLLRLQLVFELLALFLRVVQQRPGVVRPAKSHAALVPACRWLRRFCVPSPVPVPACRWPVDPTDIAQRHVVVELAALDHDVAVLTQRCHHRLVELALQIVVIGRGGDLGAVLRIERLCLISSNWCWAA